MEGTPLFKTLNFPTVCAGCRVSWTLTNAPPPLPGTKPLLIGPLFGFVIAAAPRAEPENIFLFLKITMQTNFKNPFFGHHLLSLPFFHGTEGCPPFSSDSQYVNKWLQPHINRFLCPPTKKMTTNCSKLIQPDLLDNTGKNTIADNPS